MIRSQIKRSKFVLFLVISSSCNIRNDWQLYLFLIYHFHIVMGGLPRFSGQTNPGKKKEKGKEIECRIEYFKFNFDFRVTGGKSERFFPGNLSFLLYFEI